MTDLLDTAQRNLRKLQDKPDSQARGTGGTVAVYGTMQIVMVIVRWVTNEKLHLEVPEDVLVAIGILLAGPTEHFRRKWRLFA